MGGRPRAHHHAAQPQAAALLRQRAGHGLPHGVRSWGAPTHIRMHFPALTPPLHITHSPLCSRSTARCRHRPRRAVDARHVHLRRADRVVQALRRPSFASIRLSLSSTPLSLSLKHCVTPHLLRSGDCRPDIPPCLSVSSLSCPPLCERSYKHKLLKAATSMPQGLMLPADSDAPGVSKARSWTRTD